MKLYYDRRTFLKQSLSAGAGIALLNTSLKPFATEKQNKVRVGLIGVGLRGQLHLTEMLKRADVEVIALADSQAVMMQSSLKIVRDFGKKEPVVYGT